MHRGEEHDAGGRGHSVQDKADKADKANTTIEKKIRQISLGTRGGGNMARRREGERVRGETGSESEKDIFSRSTLL